MDRRDNDAIEQLFAKLADVEQRSPGRDAEAEAFIAERLRAQPGAAYYMAQTIIAQEAALERAAERIDEADRAAAARPAGQGFGGAGANAAAPSQRGGAGPWGARSGRGGGFLAGAAQTALGVTGGVLLGSALAGMFAGDAEAAPAGASEDPAAATEGAGDEGAAGVEDAGADMGGDDGGGFFDSLGDW